MLDILAITGPIYLAIALGFVMTRIGLFAKADMRIFGRFVINLALPALLFKSLSQRPIGEILNGGYLLAYLVGSLTVFSLGYQFCRRFLRLNPINSTVYVLGMSCSNSGFVGYPILLLILAPIAGVVLALNMMVENLVMIPLFLVMAERSRGGGGQWYQVVGQSFMRLAAHPMIIGLVAGFSISVSGWKLPEIIVRSVDLFAMASGGVSLFVIGGTLVGLPLHGIGKRVAPIVLGKLLFHPVAVLLAILTLPLTGLPALDPSMRMAAVVMAAAPMLSIYAILTQVYGGEDFSASAMLLTTVLSFFTLSGLLWVLHHLPSWV